MPSRLLPDCSLIYSQSLFMLISHYPYQSGFSPSVKEEEEEGKEVFLHGRRGLALGHSQLDGSLLHRIPERVVANGGSTVCSLFTVQGKKCGVNQDAMIVWKNFASREDTVFCGVFDGHGPHGHMIAKKVRDSLPSKLIAYWDGNTSSDDLEENSPSTSGSINTDGTAAFSFDEEPDTYMDFEGKNKYPEKFTTLRQSFLRACGATDEELRGNPNIDCYCSGTTAVVLVKQGQDLVIGNVGDSRAILGTRDKDGSLTAVQLTVDLKPDLPGEEERIRQCKGRIFALQDEPEVTRVWLPDDESPGLAMTRAFGDFCLKDFGLISVPEISYRHITERDEFVVLATDGIWDVLSNEEVVDIVASAPVRSSAAKSLVETAIQAWQCKCSSFTDDCAVVCLFINNNPSDGLISCYETKDAEFADTPKTGKNNCKSSMLYRSGTLSCNSRLFFEEEEQQLSVLKRSGTLVQFQDLA